ncbi:hypothetical protein [Herbiconiux ginsengi]|uniref:Uncharacterized protein n=1 Tax=Herbiconiux ginsengi TaxID=381665 RepID=A0A1H3KD76_9MICO|nr:hypothetical protein [Herbiconiux ginsengi]SDY50106.1 hypothetical protein SAMN05216554_0514 [Herbiconiux ginsengi]
MSMFGFGKKDEFPDGPGKNGDGSGDGDGGDKKPNRPSNARIVIWIVVGGVGLYLIGSGLYGVLTH